MMRFNLIMQVLFSWDLPIKRHEHQGVDGEEDCHYDEVLD